MEIFLVTIPLYLEVHGYRNTALSDIKQLQKKCLPDVSLEIILHI